MEAGNFLPLVAFCASLFTISALSLLLIRRAILAITLAFAPVISITIYAFIQIIIKYEKISHGEGLVFLIYFLLYFYLSTFSGVIWGALIKYLMENAKAIKILGRHRATRFTVASALVFAPTVIILFTAWDGQRDATEACFAHGIPVEIGGRVFAPKPIRQTSVNVLGRGQAYDDRIKMNRRPSRRELCDLSERGTRPIPTGILSFHWESGGNNALFLTFNPSCDHADLREASADRINSCAAKRDAFMPYFKGMQFRIPAHEHWLLSEWGTIYRREVFDTMTPDGAMYRYRCTGPIETSFYEGGRRCIAYRFIDDKLVVQISFKTQRDEDVGTVLERFERDLGMILSELEWRQE